MSELPRYDAVMVILGTRQVDMSGLVARAATLFQDRGELLSGQQALSDTQSVVVGRHHAAAIDTVNADSLIAADLPDNGYEGPITVVRITLVCHSQTGDTSLGALRNYTLDLLQALAVVTLPDFVLLPGSARLIHGDSLTTVLPIKDGSQRFAPVEKTAARLHQTAYRQSSDPSETDTGTGPLSRPRTGPSRLTPETYDYVIDDESWLDRSLNGLKGAMLSRALHRRPHRGRTAKPDVSWAAVSFSGIWVLLGATGAMAAMMSALPY